MVTGRDSVERFTNGGIDLNGKLSDPLLQSLFDPNSEGHDGAVCQFGSGDPDDVFEQWFSLVSVQLSVLD